MVDVEAGVVEVVAAGVLPKRLPPPNKVPPAAPAADCVVDPGVAADVPSTGLGGRPKMLVLGPVVEVVVAEVGTTIRVSVAYERRCC